MGEWETKKPDETGRLKDIELDTNGDGKIDTVLSDTTGDGRLDTVYIDEDGDGTPDTILMDLDGDGIMDAEVDYTLSSEKDELPEDEEEDEEV